MNLIRTPPISEVAIFRLHYNSLQILSHKHITPKQLPQKSTVEQKQVSDHQPPPNNGKHMYVNMYKCYCVSVYAYAKIF